jgi:hypothetical protein
MNHEPATAVPRDFWLSSGHHLLEHDEQGRLVVTDEFIKLYLARPEVLPPAEACLAERGLHARLMRAPRSAVTMAEIADIADRDARENWRYFAAFRDHLTVSGTVEAAYVALATAAKVTIPPMFLSQLVHVILRNALDGGHDAMRLRAAEMLYRPQRLTLRDGVILLADEELVDGSEVVDHASPLVAIFGEARARDLEILDAGKGPLYWDRSDAHDFVVDFRPKQAARTALAKVLAIWVRHLTGVGVTVTPAERVDEKNWAWFVGLDQEGTRIGNALWNGGEPADNGRERIVALFTLTFDDPADMAAAVAGRPVTLILGMTPQRIIRMKPQNLIAGLPFRAPPTGMILPQRKN